MGSGRNVLSLPFMGRVAEPEARSGGVRACGVRCQNTPQPWLRFAAPSLPMKGREKVDPRIERGDESPVKPVLASPRQVRVGTWPLRFRTLASAPAGRTPKTVGCILAAPVRCRSAEDFRPRRRSSILAWFPSTPRRNAKGLGPGPCPGFPRPPKRLGNLGQRAGPTRLKFRLSPDFRAAVSLGPLTFRRKPLDGKRPDSPRCARRPGGRWTTL
jgi:hypothetical protein